MAIHWPSEPSHRVGAPEERPFGRSAYVALAGGFLVIAAATATIGPQVGQVAAGDDAGIREFLTREARSRAARAAPAMRPVAYAPLPSFNALPAAQRAIVRATRSETTRKRRPVGAAKAVEKAASSAHAYGGALSVCVRTCDGYNFPIAPISAPGDVANHAALCASLCPGAATQLYTMAPGADGIDKAVSRTGKPYAALSTALRYAAKTDKACTCGAPGRTQASYVSLYRDFTLRRGDSVMTPKGVRVFAGARRYPFRDRDFARLSKAGLPKARHGELLALERASKRAPAAWTPAPERAAAAAAPARHVSGANGVTLRAFGPMADATFAARR